MSTPPAPVTCFIRTKNEERMIGPVIEAAKAAVDDVVIVDSGSSDATIEIAERLGARVIRQPWLGNGKQKRVGEDHSKHDWVLDLDADEVVSPKLAELIRDLFAAGPPPFSIYQLDLVTVPPIGEPWYDVAVADRKKLYDKRIVRAPDHAAWDQFEPPNGVQVGRLRAPLYHHSFRDFEHFMGKLNRISSVRARESKLKPLWVIALRIWLAPPFYFMKHFLAREHWKLGLYGVAIAGMSAHGRWLRDIKMLEIHLKRRQEQNAKR
ncbi:MAG TPA: glycosyltransferase family 2 protein [Terricaulis sp.]|nr:glycosyltransferase family 2 protein [Terricaulis sp.]HRP09835.1 glycosyltransferase family 2 protein [Terricaulis sp.]